MPDNASLFAALGDETRLNLINRLGSEGPSSIIGLTRGGSLSRQAVTKHLYVLEKAGLVRCARVGRASLWEVKHARLTEARDYLDRMSKAWDVRIGRLRQMIEE